MKIRYELYITYFCLTFNKFFRVDYEIKFTHKYIDHI